MKKIILLLALFSVIFTLTSCQKAEEITVTKYFQSMQANDKDTMAAMAVEPKDIEFKSFKLTVAGEPTISPQALPNLQKQKTDLTKARREQVNVALDKRDEVDELQFELEETRRRTKKQELEKRIKELETELEAEEQKVKDIQAQINQITQMIKLEKSMITMSTGINQKFELYSGETHSMKVLADVTLTNNDTKKYVFVLRKDILKLEDRALPPGRLIITKIETEEDFEKMMQEKDEAGKTQTEEVTEEQPVTEEQQ
jgi:predicted RNase H-like nuclease (RuvC/YqgF family)